MLRNRDLAHCTIVQLGVLGQEMHQAFTVRLLEVIDLQIVEWIGLFLIHLAMMIKNVGVSIVLTPDFGDRIDGL